MRHETSIFTAQTSQTEKRTRRTTFGNSVMARSCVAFLDTNNVLIWSTTVQMTTIDDDIPPRIASCASTHPQAHIHSAVTSIPSSSLLSKSLDTYCQKLRFSTDGVDVLIVQFSPACIEPFYFCPSSIGCGIPRIPYRCLPQFVRFALSALHGQDHLVPIRRWSETSDTGAPEPNSPRNANPKWLSANPYRDN